MKKTILGGLLLSLIGCSTHQPTNGTTIDDSTVILHQGIHGNAALSGTDAQRGAVVANALMPRLSDHFPHARSLHQRFDVAVKDVPASLFYMQLVAGTPVSIIVSPQVTGNVTLNLKQVTIEQALKAVEDTYGYIYQRIPGGYKIMPNKLQTQLFSMNYLELQRSGDSKMELSSGEVTEVMQQSGGGGSSTDFGSSTSSAASISSQGQSNGSTTVASGLGSVETRSTFDFWSQLQVTLKNIIGHGRGRNVTINPLAGVAVVRAYPKELRQVQQYLNLVQKNVDRQVLLEAQILEVTLNNNYQMGINWHIFGAHLNSIGTFPGTDISIDTFPSNFTIQIDWMKNFSTFIQALETQGNVQVLSSPRVTTMNNQKSLIKVGDDSFYVTDLTPNTVVAAVPSTTSNSSFTPSFTPFFSGITLDVTPQVDHNGDVTLHIHPSISNVTQQDVSVNLGNGSVINLPMATSTIRESDTIVHAKNGQVVVLGGLMQNQTTETVAEMPFFGNIPFLGTLLRNTKQTSQKTELVILLKPTVVNKRSLNAALNDAAQRFAGAKRGFHFGGRPDLYGTEGESPIIKGPVAGNFAQPGKVWKGTDVVGPERNK